MFRGCNNLIITWAGKIKLNKYSCKQFSPTINYNFFNYVIVIITIKEQNLLTTSFWMISHKSFRSSELQNLLDAMMSTLLLLEELKTNTSKANSRVNFTSLYVYMRQTIKFLQGHILFCFFWRS